MYKSVSLKLTVPIVFCIIEFVFSNNFFNLQTYLLKLSLKKMAMRSKLAEFIIANSLQGYKILRTLLSKSIGY